MTSWRAGTWGDRSWAAGSAKLPCTARPGRARGAQIRDRGGVARLTWRPRRSPRAVRSSRASGPGRNWARARGGGAAGPAAPRSQVARGRTRAPALPAGPSSASSPAMVRGGRAGARAGGGGRGFRRARSVPPAAPPLPEPRLEMRAQPRSSPQLRPSGARSCAGCPVPPLGDRVSATLGGISAVQDGRRGAALCGRRRGPGAAACGAGRDLELWMCAGRLLRGEKKSGHRCSYVLTVLQMTSSVGV